MGGGEKWQTSFMACISSLTKATIAAIKLTSAHTGTDSHEHQEAAGAAQQRGTAEPGNSMCQAGQFPQGFMQISPTNWGTQATHCTSPFHSERLEEEW